MLSSNHVVSREQEDAMTTCVTTSVVEYRKMFTE